MSKPAAIQQKPGSNGNANPGNQKNGNELVKEAKEIISSKPNEEKTEVKTPNVIKEMTLQEKIMKVENLGLVIEKRAKLVQTRSELERFQTTSNDFNCTMRLNDSDGNTFTTSFTPGIKKVIEFLKTSFDSSIQDVETKIQF